MDARAILQKIDEDAHQAAAKVLEDARARAQALRDQSAAAIEKQKAESRQRAERDAEEAERRMHRMAELEDKKALLAAKRDTMNTAFDQALAMLHAMPAEQARAYMLRQLAQAAQGNEELLVGDVADEWFNPAFVSEANAALKAAGKPGAIKLSAARVRGCGFALRRGGAQVNCTCEAFIESARHHMEADVARMLFD